MAKTRVKCAEQQFIVRGLAERNASVSVNIDTQQPTPGARSQGGHMPSRGSDGTAADPLRSILEQLRARGASVHGMLADLVLVRRQRDETAVSAVLGPKLRNTVVVQRRSDGARVVNAVKAAGIKGQVRCDILEEMRDPAVDSGGSGEIACMHVVVDRSD